MSESIEKPYKVLRLLFSRCSNNSVLLRMTIYFIHAERSRSIVMLKRTHPPTLLGMKFINYFF